MKDKLAKLPDLPTLGIFAFALASTWALYQFFINAAVHPTWLYWIPAALVEIVTAWLTKHAVEAMYQITRSKTLKQDKRFFKIVAGVSIALCVPTFVASVQANLYEFAGQFWLALLFPIAVIGCAIGAQIPRSVVRHTSEKTDVGKAELRSLRAELRQMKQARQMKPPSAAVYSQLCADMNGNLPTTARAVNKLLNDHGHYAAPDRTAASWIRKRRPNE